MIKAEFSKEGEWQEQVDVTAINIQIHLVSVKYYSWRLTEADKRCRKVNGQRSFSQERRKVQSLQMQGDYRK